MQHICYIKSLLFTWQGLLKYVTDQFTWQMSIECIDRIRGTQHLVLEYNQYVLNQLLPSTQCGTQFLKVIEKNVSLPHPRFVPERWKEEIFGCISGMSHQ